MRWLILLLLAVGSLAQEWDAYNFPNPTAGQFRECKMRTTANICDPDGVLSEQARYRLDHDLKQLERVTAAMAIARHVKGASTEVVCHFL
ncbi:unnamed protein product [Cylicostephanus goldi]|uniref:Uncharacterized protein n=1 Tax=Cylicostephanus goldi TaxID=71465 RepID=A0A3P7MNI2_CYLGO|nr:unnamed protein product [Cylicostephanus goldi]